MADFHHFLKLKSVLIIRRYNSPQSGEIIPVHDSAISFRKDIHEDLYRIKIQKSLSTFFLSKVNHLEEISLG